MVAPLVGFAPQVKLLSRLKLHRFRIAGRNACWAGALAARRRTGTGSARLAIEFHAIKLLDASWCVGKSSMAEPTANASDASAARSSSAILPHPQAIHTALADGRAICIRRIGPGDEARMRAGLARMSKRSLYLRFFSGMAVPPDWVIARLLDADSHSHLAWGALDTERADSPAIGAVHAFRDAARPTCAEFSVAVLDEYHGRGLGKLLTATILHEARAQGIAGFRVHVLAENRSALDFTRMLGGRHAGTGDGAHQYHLEVDEALARLRAACEPAGMAAVFARFG